MKVILLTDVKKLGRRGEVKEVANGYAQSVLLPRKLALPGTPENLKKAEQALARTEDKKAFDHALLAKTLASFEGKTLTIPVKANSTGALFKAIHEKQIGDEIKKQFGVDLPSSMVKLDEPIKKSGVYQIYVGGEGIQVALTLKV